MSVGLLPELGDEQQMLLEASTRFMDDRCPLSLVRSRADNHEALGSDYRESASELGWFGLLASEIHGGGSTSGNGVIDAAIIAAERGARLQPGPYIGHIIVVHALSKAGSPSQLEMLSQLIDGRAWATWVFSEEPAFELNGAGRLTGTADAVAEVIGCEWLLVTARSPRGTTQVLVRTDAPGVTVRRLEGLDVSRSWSTVAIDCAVGAHDIVGAPGRPSDELVAQQTLIAAVLTAAESVGAMSSDFAMVLQYSKDRVAFGRPIGSFQAIKHLLADTSLWLEMAKGLVADAATAVGNEAPDGPSLAHAAKSFVGEKGIESAQNCFQVFGGIGYTWEHDQHLFLRRLVADAASFGAPSWHRAQILEREGVA